MKAIDLDYISRLASVNEGADVEFKETTGQLDRGMEALCGMLNGNGGVVVFGVNNHGKIIGQEIADKTTRMIGVALTRFEPAVDIQPQYIHLPDTEKYLIVFHADNLESEKPFSYNGTPYQRSDSVTSVMPQSKFVRLLELRGGLKYKWEAVINEDVELSDLDERRIQGALRGAMNQGKLDASAYTDEIPAILTKFNVMRKGMLQLFYLARILQIIRNV